MGLLEEKVLAMIKRLSIEDRAAAHASKITEKLEGQEGRDLTLTQILNALDKLEKRKSITGFMVEKTDKRGGRRKRAYELTAKGCDQLDHLAKIYSF